MATTPPEYKEMKVKGGDNFMNHKIRKEFFGKLVNPIPVLNDLAYTLRIIVTQFQLTPYNQVEYVVHYLDRKGGSIREDKMKLDTIENVEALYNIKIV